MRTVLLLCLLALPAVAGRAVTLDGALLKGELRVDGEDLVLLRGQKERRYPRADYLLVEQEDGTLLWAPDFDARLRGYTYLARARQRDLLVKLLKKALDARARQLGRELLDRAEQAGYTGKQAEKLKRRLERLERGATTPDVAKTEEVRRRLGEVAAIYPELLVARARRGGEGGLRVLREALRADPSFAPARAFLKERAPRDFPVGDATFWLDWRLDLEGNGATLVPDSQEDLVRARRQWRKDLYGIKAGPIRLLTSVRDTRTVGRCFAYGRLVCSVLADMFRTDQPRLRYSKALLVFLYAGKEEYLTTSGTSRPVEERAFLKLTAGHYSPLERVSRVVWHTDRDAERRIARVFVHELTHHWVTELNPRYSNAELRLSSGVPGYWIVEGLATFLDEGRYDVEAGTWELFDSRASSLDTVHAVARQGKLIPWPDLYALNNRTFRALVGKKGGGQRIVRRWFLGTYGISRARLFYEQAAATVHFLYHGENGRYRAQLIDYVTHHYTGKKDKLTIQAAFGLEPADLGRKVVAFAAQVAAGWRPAAPG